MVKNQIIVSSFREIKSSLSRFLSLLMMSLLGVFVFVGLKATNPFMVNSLDKYLDSQNIYDIKLTSTIGFDDDSINKLKENNQILDVEGANYTDIEFKGKNDKDYTIRIHSNQEIINHTNLVMNGNDLYVEQNFLDVTGYTIGDTISLLNSEFKYSEFIIKGSMDSALYFNNAKLNTNHGKTNIGSGTLNFYGFVDKEVFNIDYYKNIYITVKNAKSETTNSNKYKSLVNEVLKNINSDVIIENRLKTLNDNLNSINEGISNYNYYQEKVDLYDKTEKEVDEALENLGFTSYNDFIDYYNSLETKEDNLTKLYNSINELKNDRLTIEVIRSTLSSLKYAYEESIITKEEISKLINNCQVIKNDRLDDSTYKSYIDDAKSIENLSSLFPIVFYAVAILVSLVSMNRMVEDDRIIIGTFKSLGFDNKHILTKYLLFSLIATILGGLIGAVAGIFIIPTMINNIYKILFDLPKFYYGLNLIPTLIGFFFSAVCICGVTLFTVLKVLKEKPAELLRPKSPKAGKRILIEKSKIWKKISFSNKITIRNLVRYKKRVIITILSITGCCALMLCGFGIKDSIADLPTKQYEYIIQEDATIILNNVDYNQANDILNKKEIKDNTKIMNINGTIDNYDINIDILDDNYGNFINFYDVNNKEKVSLEDDSVIISDKLASLLKVKKGDSITFYDSSLNEYTYKISAVCEYYISHYVYMSKNTYEKTNNKYYVNCAYLNLIDLNETQKNALQIELLENENVLNLSYVSSIISSANDMLKTLNKVVIILIVLSAMLSFVVLYNLSSINIQERKREIATLKVLGFYPKEVDHYITTENIILTIFGIILGLIFGYFFTNIVVSTVEIEYVRFIHKIKIFSYVYSALMSIIFTLIVNFITHFSLKNINMIESLKSVE